MRDDEQWRFRFSGIFFLIEFLGNFLQCNFFFSKGNFGDSDVGFGTGKDLEQEKDLKGIENQGSDTKMM